MFSTPKQSRHGACRSAPEAAHRRRAGEGPISAGENGWNEEEKLHKNHERVKRRMRQRRRCGGEAACIGAEAGCDARIDPLSSQSSCCSEATLLHRRHPHPAPPTSSGRPTRAPSHPAQPDAGLDESRPSCNFFESLSPDLDGPHSRFMSFSFSLFERSAGFC